MVVQLIHVAAIHDEQRGVMLAASPGGVHILKDITVRRAAGIVTRAQEAASVRPER